MISHILRCNHVIEETKEKAREEKGRKKDERRGSSSKQATLLIPTTTSAEPASKCQRTIQQNLSVVATKRWTPGQQHSFEKDLCDLFVSCDIRWNVVTNPQMGLFVKKWIPGADLPDRRDLAGSILKEHVREVEGSTKERVKGKLATGQCDGWKNIAKTPLIATVITVEFEVRYYGFEH